MAKIKNWTPKFVALGIVCLLVGVGISLLGYHYLRSTGMKPPEKNPTKLIEVELTKKMVDKIILLENGKKGQININSEEGLGIASTLTRKLHELNLQSTCVFSEEDIQEIEQKDRSLMLFFKKPIDITISQWVEPEERYHIPVDEKGYRILEDVKTALFILEDRQNEGLEAHILVGSEREDKDEKCYWKINQEDLKKLGPCEGSVGYIFSEEHGCSYVFGCHYDPEIVPFKTRGECELACGRMWSCWAINIKEEGSNEIDKSWIDGINKILTLEKSEEFCGWSTYAKCKIDADCNMGGCSSQVCEGKGERTMTDCRARDCYYRAGYKCGCVDNKCQWAR